AGQLALRAAAAAAVAAEAATTIAAEATLARRARRTAIGDRQGVALDLEIGRADLAATIDQGEAQRLALGQAGKPGLLDRADMDEHVLGAIVADDEAEALLAVEEFDHAGAFADD